MPWSKLLIDPRFISNLAVPVSKDERKLLCTIIVNIMP